MSTLATWDKITGALGSTTSTFGGQWGNLISDFMNGIDVGLSDPTKLPRPNTLTRWKHEKFGLFDGDESHHVLFSVNDIDTGSTRKIVIRRMVSPNETDYMVMENLTQTLTAKSLDFSQNTATNIPTSAISNNAITQVKMADNSVGTAEILDGNVTLDKLASDSVNSDKIINDSIMNIDINSNAQIAHTKIGTNLKHSETGLTGVRTVTHPDVSYKALGEANTAPITNKTVDITTNTINRLSKYGAYQCATLRGIDTIGQLQGLVGIGQQFDAGNNSMGNHHVWQTLSGVVNDTAGVVKFDSPISKRVRTPLLRFCFLFNHNVAQQRRIFKGFGPARLLDGSNTVPVTNSESCFLFGHGNTDTEFQIFHNDGAGTCQKLTTGVTIPTSDTNYILEIQASDSPAQFTWTLFNVNTIGDKTTTAGTGTISTRIPGQTTSLYFHDILQSATGTLHPTRIYYNEVFTK